MSSTTDTEIAPNAKRLLWAGFMAILAAGVGFAIRGGIFDNWGGEYGFTALELGAIGGAGHEQSFHLTRRFVRALFEAICETSESVL